MKKNLFERFRDGELGEIQKRAFSFASRSHLADEFNFLAGFFIGRHFDEVLQADMDDSEKKAQKEMYENGLVLQSDRDKTIAQNFVLKTQVEKMRELINRYYQVCAQIPKELRTMSFDSCLEDTRKMVAEEWVKSVKISNN